MKKISFLFGTLLMAGLLSFTQVNAQIDGFVFADEDFAYLTLGDDYFLAAETYNYVQTPSGNYTVNVTWYLNPDNPFIPEKGVNKVTLLGFIDWWWIIPIEVSIDDAVINKHGKCHAVFHVNGSGNGF